MRHLVTGLSVFLAAVVLAAPASAQQPSQAPAPATQAGTQAAASSPWLVVPVFSVDPKLGTSLGAMAGYMHHFDEKSRLSILGAHAQWTSTGSTVAGLFGTAS